MQTRQRPRARGMHWAPGPREVGAARPAGRRGTRVGKKQAEKRTRACAGVSGEQLNRRRTEWVRCSAALAPEVLGRGLGQEEQGAACRGAHRVGDAPGRLALCKGHSPGPVLGGSGGIPARSARPRGHGVGTQEIRRCSQPRREAAHVSAGDPLGSGASGPWKVDCGPPVPSTSHAGPGSICFTPTGGRGDTTSLQVGLSAHLRPAALERPRRTHAAPGGAWVSAPHVPPEHVWVQSQAQVWRWAPAACCLHP